MIIEADKELYPITITLGTNLLNVHLNMFWFQPCAKGHTYQLWSNVAQNVQEMLKIWKVNGSPDNADS